MNIPWKKANLKTQTGVTYVCKGKNKETCGHPWFIQHVNYKPGKCHCGKPFPKFIWQKNKKQWINSDKLKNGRKR